MSTDASLLGRLALHYKLLTRDQLVESLQQQEREGHRRKIGDIWVENGWMTPQRFDQLLRAQREYEERQRTQAAPVEPAAAPRGALAQLLAFAAEQRASDLHLHAGLPVRLRIHGDFRPLPGAPLSADETRQLLAEVLTPAQRETVERHGQVDFAYTLAGVGRFRANVYRQQRGWDGVFRVIPAEPPSLSDLGLPLDLARFANFHQGLVLITGPTGSGKSSTLAALVRIVNEERRDHIITIEDPVEFVHRSQRCVVNQRQVGAHTKSFSRALRAALREDPDVIVVGELRDLETISLALTAAETGHLVLATLHTQNAINTVNRIIGVFPAEQQSQIRTMVSESLRVITSQRLVLRADGRGRVAALEIMVANKAVSNLIRENKNFQLRSVLQTGGAQGMRFLDHSLDELVKAGTIRREEAARHAEDPKRFSGRPVTSGSGSLNVAAAAASVAPMPRPAG
ncbi:MAG TPA: type IV pilus twitching motility protein PilT [Thermoanaerobaculia bacterium]|nr:type IV pilus twitching motility protein PilT [Thermoanaerobaculia bacterium]